MKHLLFIILLSTVVSVNAQKSHSIYGELLGNGLLYSVNYDFALSKTTKNWRAKVGLSALAYPIFITQTNYLLGKNKYFLELGLGANFLPYEDDGFKLLVTPNAAIQFRFQSEIGFLFRAGLAPSFIPVFSDGVDYSDIGYWLWPGISIGWSF